MSDYYATLGVSKEASNNEIKKGYRKQALKCHPDRNPDNPEAEKHFKEVSEAYEVLSNEQKRAVYDQYGKAGLEGGQGMPGSGNGAGFANMEDALRTFMGAFGGGGGDSIFESFFGGGPGGSAGAGAMRGASKKVSLTVSFEEAALGCERELSVTTRSTCVDCKGSGASKPSAIRTCSQCGGSGQVVESRGFFSMAMTCPRCNGEGRMVTDPCKSCRGEGKTKEKRHVKVAVPPGVDTGMRLKMTGYGDAGDTGGPPGDLYVFITVQDHEFFQRDGDDLYVDMPLSFSDAALGCYKEIPTLNGKVVKLTIPQGTQSGKTFRVRGEGFPNVHGHGKGDILVRVHVETPTNLSSRQKELLEEFGSLENPQNSPKKKGFFNKLKDCFGLSSAF
jgi:molecular chaperone DnaJ